MFRTIPEKILRWFKKTEVFDGITGFTPSFGDIEEFKRANSIKCHAKNVRELILFLNRMPNQRFYVFKAVRGVKGGVINVGSFETFPTIDDALIWLDNYGGGRYYVKAESLGKKKIGYYGFEGKDKEQTWMFNYKPKDIKEALLLERILDGDYRLIDKIVNSGNSGKRKYNLSGTIRKHCFKNRAYSGKVVHSLL